MKTLIITRCDDNIKNITDISHPLLKKYAEFTKSDFLTLDGSPPSETDDDRPHFRIMEAYNLLGEYDRILSVDSDVILNRNTPNIFDVVPYDNIGSVYEDVGSRAQHRRNVMSEAQRKFKEIGWKQGYINTGFFVVSKPHRNIFTPIDGGYWTGFGSDDVHLGYQINKHGFNVHELSFRWNHMTMFSEPWNHNAHRFNSHVIHYAGGGTFDQTDRIGQMKSDLMTIYGEET